MSFGEYFNAFGSLGDTFIAARDHADQRRYSEDAAALAGKQLDGYLAAQGQGGLPGLGGQQVPMQGGLSPLGVSTAPKLPSFAGGGAPMSLPTGDTKEIENKFVGALKDGGLTNPFGLAAAAAYAQRESRYNPKNIVGSWSDPSESGQAGQSGGILSWRADRLNNMRAFTAGAKDPVTAQAKFFLTEDPDTTLALQRAKSPEEANDILAKAWKFAGYNRPGGGEYAARLGTTRAYLDRIGGIGTGQPPGAPTQVAGIPQSLPPGASGLNPAFKPPQRPVQFAETEADVQRLEQGMMPGAAAPAPVGQPKVLIPQSMAGAGIPGTVMGRGNPVAQVASPGASAMPIPSPQQQIAGNDQADMPVPNAQPAEFRIPPGQQPQPAESPFVPGTVAAPAIGGPQQGQLPPVAGAPRLSPQQAEYLRAQLANPLTRANAIQAIQGLNAPDKWETKELGGRVVQVNSRGDVRALPGFEKPTTYQTQKGSDGNDYTFNPQTGQWTRAIEGKSEQYIDLNTPEQRAAAGIPTNYTGPAQRGPNGELRLPGKATTEVNIDQKGETAFSTTANTAIAKRFEKLSEEGDSARTDSALLGQLRGLGTVVGTGPMAAAQAYLADKGLKLGDNVGAVEAYGAIIDKMVPAQRIPGSGTTSDFDAKGFKSSLPNLMKTPEGNSLIINTLDALNSDKMARARIAEQALTGEIKPQEAVRQLRGLPPPNIVFKSGLAELAKAGKLSGSGSVDPGSAPQAAGSNAPQAQQLKPMAPDLMSEARAAIAAGKPAAAVIQRLRQNGYDPAGL